VAGFKGDIVPVDDESDIPVSGDYILYHPKNYKLIDSPRNAAINEGVGTSAGTFIPSTDIQGVTRGSTSSNPGSFQLLFAVPVFQDVSLRTQDDPEIVNNFYRNPFAPGPGPNKEFVTLPDDTVPVFVVIGDSTANGFYSADTTLEEVEEQVAAYGTTWPQTANAASAFGWVWNKYMSTSDNGVTFDKEVGALIDTTTSGDGWIPFHPRVGGPNLIGSFTYAPSAGQTFAEAMYVDPLTVGQPGQNMPPAWAFAVANKGLFRYSSGEIVSPYFIFAPFNSQRLGTPGTSYGAFGTLDYYAKYTDAGFTNVGGTFEQVRSRYIRPAVRNIIDFLGKNPVLAGELIMMGASEGNINNPLDWTLSAFDSYFDHITAMKATFNTGQDYPVVMYESYYGNDAFYPPSRIDVLRKAVTRLFLDGHRAKVSINDLPRVSKDDLSHFKPLSYKTYGERFAATYRNLLTARAYPAVAPTMANIID
jgi:hypothetical protein